MSHFRDKTFTIEPGPNLPRPLAGHCQVHIDKGRIFVLGGITSLLPNGTQLDYSSDAFLWYQDNWITVPTKSPCPTENIQNLAFHLQCTTRIKLNQTEIVSVTINASNVCTNVLNLVSLQWFKVNNGNAKLPIGGHLVTGVDKGRVFYLGGYYESVKSLDVYELTDNG